VAAKVQRLSFREIRLPLNPNTGILPRSLNDGLIAPSIRSVRNRIACCPRSQRHKKGPASALSHYVCLSLLEVLIKEGFSKNAQSKRRTVRAP